MPYSEETARSLIGSEYVKLGKDLSPEDQKKVKREFVYRFTGEHTPKWAAELRPDGSRYMPQHRNDAEWLAETWFAVTKSGKFCERYTSCCSQATFPFGKSSVNNQTPPTTH